MSITKRGHGTYLIRISAGYGDGKQKRINETFRGTLRDAKVREAELKAEIKANPKKCMTITERKAGPLVSELMNLYLEQLAREIEVGNLHNTYIRGAINAKKRINAAFGDVRIGSLKPEKVNAWIDDMHHSGLSNKTIKNYTSILTQAMKCAVENGIIEEDHITPNMKKPKVPKNKNGKYFTREEIEKILFTLEESENYSLDVKCAVYIAIHCGLRHSEIIGLNVSDVDFERNLLNIQRAAHLLNGKLILDTPKSKSSIRSVPIPHDICKHLIARLVTKHKMDALSQNWDVENPDDPPLFWTGPNSKHGPGKRMRPSYLKKEFDKLTREAGVYEPGKSLHACRHYLVSELVAHNADLQSITDIMGHNSIAITVEVYSHALASINYDIINDIYNERRIRADKDPYETEDIRHELGQTYDEFHKRNEDKLPDGMDFTDHKEILDIFKDDELFE